MIIARQERERERERELLAYIGTRRDFTDQGYGTIAISSSFFSVSPANVMYLKVGVMRACSIDSLHYVLGLIPIDDTWGFGYPYI